MAAVIQDILNNGKAINYELGKKIGLLAERNGRFKETFTKKLTDINTAIERFKSTNLQGLTETKERLTNVTNELNATKDTLIRTQSELEQIRSALSTNQAQLQNISETKTGLEQKERGLNDRIRQLETEYQTNINGVKEQMSQQSNAEKAAMKREFDNQIALLNGEKAELQKGIQNAQQSQSEVVNRVSALQNEQSNLVNNLGEINSLLTKQLELISNINTEQPNDDEYSQLLEVIQINLGGVISEINQAVSGQGVSGQRVSGQGFSGQGFSGQGFSGQNRTGYDVETNFNNLMSLYKPEDKRQYQASLKIIDGRVSNEINRNIVNAYRGEQQAINEIKRVLSDNQTIIKKPNFFNRFMGGKRRRNARKTMKKRYRKSRKLVKSRKLNQRGGYVYSSSRELDKSSSIVSAPSGSKSRTRTKNKLRNKTKTKTRTPSSSNTEKTI